MGTQNEWEGPREWVRPWGSGVGSAMHCSGVTSDNGPAVNGPAVTSRNCVLDPRKNETLDVATSKWRKEQSKLTPTCIRERLGSNLCRHTGNSRWRFPWFIQCLKQIQGTAYNFHTPSNSSEPHQPVYLHGVRSGEADSSWAGQGIPGISWNQSVHCTLATTPLPVAIHSL